MSDDAPKVMWSIGKIAERDGISKQAVSKIVKKLVAEHDIPVDRDGRGRISAVSLAHWDHHRGQFTNPAKQPVRESTKGKPPAADSFEEARRQNEWLRLERSRIEHQEMAGKLVRRDQLDASIEMIGREIQTIVARLPNSADDLALAVSKEGAHGLRSALRDLAFKINGQVADRLAEIAGGAPKTEPVMEDDAA
ncbi:hypothetical protein [Oricola indica]|jgi:hypothetical protein|uniref:hypothetical protein n=1 Tax=Oricola indica TaxID=2872591 RepID=UPI001CBF171D|nr:hypothetical protein [Oricola indica]